MNYVCYFNCPHCKKPTCGFDPMKGGNEIFFAPTRAKAVEMFNAYKPCRHMKITKVRKIHTLDEYDEPEKVVDFYEGLDPWEIITL